MEANANTQLDFVRPSRHAAMVTFRRDGSLQTSPVVTVPDPDGHLLIWSRVTTAKTHNLARDPRTSLCIVGDNFSGWMQVDGNVEIIHLPEAMAVLEGYYRLRWLEENQNWEEYRQKMIAEQRVVLRVIPTRIFRPPAQ